MADKLSHNAMLCHRLQRSVDPTLIASAEEGVANKFLGKLIR